MSPSRKVSKRQMKDDRFVRTVLEARDWATENLSGVLIGVGAVVVIIVGIWLVGSRSSSSAQSASDLLGRAEMELRTGQTQLAVIDFQKVLDDFGSSDAAKLACFKLANAYYAQADFVKAEEYYQRYLDKYVIDDISRFAALEGIAGSYAGQGRFAEAATKYLEVAKLNPKSVTYPHDLFAVVENAIKAEDHATAREALSLLEKEGITSEIYRTAKILMIEHGFLTYNAGDYE
ncbi:MAG: outer membrane protein assembly factor BamD [bacterium]